MVNRKKLNAWICRQILVDHDEGPCRRIVIRHVVSGKGVSVGEVQIHGSTNTDALANQVEDILISDAEELGETQQYSIRAAFGETADTEQLGNDRFTCRLTIEKDANHDEEFSDSASPKGIISQLMRHNEVMARLLVNSTGETIRSQAHQIRNKDEHLERLLGARFEQVQLTEELLTQKHERDLQHKLLENSERRKESAFEKLSLLVPVVINKLAGKKVFPEELRGEMGSLHSLITSITPEQLAKLGEVLNPAQAVALLGIYETIAGTEKAGADKAKNGSMTKS